MFIDKIKRLSMFNSEEKTFRFYRSIMRLKLISDAICNCRPKCCMWLPLSIRLDEFNKFIEEDGVDCIFLRSNVKNTKQRVFVSEIINQEDFWIMVKRNKAKSDKDKHNIEKARIKSINDKN